MSFNPWRGTLRPSRSPLAVLPSRRSYRVALVLALVGAVMPFAWYWARGATSMCDRDPALYAIPALSYLKQMLAEGQLHLWNPYLSCGMPTYALTMGTHYYPGNLLFAWLSPTRDLLYYLLAHQVVATLGCFGLLKARRLHPLACLGGSWLYLYSGTRLFYFLYWESWAVFTWLPFVLWATERLGRRPGPRPAAGLALALALVSLGTGPQFSALFLGWWLLYALYRCRRARRWLLPGLAGAALLVAPQILDAREMLALDPARSAFGVTYASATSAPLDAQSAALAVYPAFFGSKEQVEGRFFAFHMHERGYQPGLAGLYLLALGLLHRKRRREAVYLLGLLAVGGSLAVGSLNPLHHWLWAHVPLFQGMRYVSRFLLFFPVVFMLVGASGLEVWLRGGERRRALAVLGLGGFAYALYLAWGAPGWTVGHFLTLGSLLAFALALRFRAFLLIAFACTVAAQFCAQVDSVLGVPPPPYAEQERDFLRQVSLPPGGRICYAANPQSAMLVPLPTISSNFPLAPRRSIEYLYASLRGRVPAPAELRRWGDANFEVLQLLTPDATLSSPLCSLLGVHWWITPAAMAPGATPFPPAWLVPRARTGGLAELLQMDLRQEVLLEAPGPPGTGGSAKLAERLPERAVFEVEGSGWLTLNESWSPSWTAHVDGRPRECLRADYSMQAVRIEAGEHRVVLSYLPASVRYGWVLSLLGAAWVACLIWARQPPRAVL